MDLGLGGKRAAVAAASGGLGFGIARELAGAGCRVGICGRDRFRIERAAAQLREEKGAEVVPAVVDVAEEGATTAWLDGLAAGWEGLDLVVANAGGPPPGRFADTRPADWDAAYRLTLRSALEIAAAARAHLRSGGALLFMTGAVVRQPVGTLVLSGIMRSGVAALAKGLADEWAPAGIRVNHLIPGRVATERVAALDSDTAQRLGIGVGEARAGFEAQIPLGRYGSVEEFARAAAFLLSDAAAYITGATLNVDGGMIRAIV
ncbi:MAG: SDR family oxidoreductase [Actinobacteria bacterium]|nr:SDR family oxidoreductase [Actinomycetota bacterium]